MGPALVSIIVVNFNGRQYLRHCLDSIFYNDYNNYEVIIVDNGSTDNSAEFIKDAFPEKIDKINILKLGKNFGPAKARNEGVKIARGNYLAFLDNDTEVARNWIKEAIKGFESSARIAALQCKILSLRNKNKLDYAGEYLSNLGFLVPAAIYGEQDSGQYNFMNRVLAAKSAGMFIKKDVFTRIGGFDEDYFIFLEETDLGWRCWLAGFEVAFCPGSIVYHHFSASKEIVDKEFNNRLVRFHGTKNYILTLYKNLSTGYLVKILPLNICLWVSLSFYLLARGNIGSCLNIWKAICWNLRNLKNNTRKRIWVQKNRVIRDSVLFIDFGLLKQKSFLYFIDKFRKSQKEVITPET